MQPKYIVHALVSFSPRHVCSVLLYNYATHTYSTKKLQHVRTLDCVKTRLSTTPALHRGASNSPETGA